MTRWRVKPRRHGTRGGLGGNLGRAAGGYFLINGVVQR